MIRVYIFISGSRARYVEKASDWIRSNGNFANTLVIHPLEYSTLIKHKEIIDAWQIRPIADREGKNFCGRIDGTNVFRTSAMKREMALLYTKEESSATRTRPNVHLDNPKYPKNIVVEEACTAWLFNKSVGATIVFKPA